MRTPSLIFITVVLLLLAGCKRQEPPLPAEGEAAAVAYGDTFIEASIGEPSNLLPVLASDSASADISGLVYDSLVRYDKNLRLEGELAESWEISEDNLTITFNLRKGVKWHDDAPFTSADVLFTYRLYVDPKTPTAYAEAYRQVESFADVEVGVEREAILQGLVMQSDHHTLPSAVAEALTPARGVDDRQVALLEDALCESGKHHRACSPLCPPFSVQSYVEPVVH
jgi:ABC-type transport system substrate-binding protein